MPSEWPPAPPYESWSATCDTLHAHTQVLGKLAVALAPPEPQLQHAALRLSARGWETLPLPAPDGSGALVVALDLRTHEAVAEHSDGSVRRVALTPDRPVGEVTRELLEALGDLAGGAIEINPTPQEVPWTVPLDEDDEHAHYDTDQVTSYFAAATQRRARVGRLPRAVPRTVDAGQRVVGLVRSRREPVLRPTGRSPVRRLHHAQFDGFAGGCHRLVAGGPALRQGRLLCLRAPRPEGFAAATLSPPAARWDAALGEYVLDWDDVRSERDPHAVALEFARSAFRHACAVCDWDPALPASADGTPPPIR